MNANRRFKTGRRRRFDFALGGSLVAMLLFFGFTGPIQLTQHTLDTFEAMEVLSLPPELTVPPPPPKIERPQILVESLVEDVSDEEFRDTSFDPGDTIAMPAPPPAPDTFLQFDKAPRPKSIVTPLYPTLARQAEIEGTVRCLVTVGPRGNVLRVVIDRSEAAVFNRSAIAALEQWTWYPAEQSGNPVRATVVVPYRFSLNR